MAEGYKLYGVIDKKYAGNISFIGTRAEVAEYLGIKKASISQHMSRCNKRGVECPYILIGNMYEEETTAQRNKRYLMKKMGFIK